VAALSGGCRQAWAASSPLSKGTARARITDEARQAGCRLAQDPLWRAACDPFGSLAHQGWFAPDSDVDLMAEGLAAGDYWQAWRLVEETVADHAVDLIELETASPVLLQSIRRHGVEL
jgi:predicted nucleotidyltransferase